MRHTVLLAIGLLLSACTKDPPRSWVLAGGEWLDVEGGVMRPNGAIVVRDGRIDSIVDPGDPPPGDLPVLDASGLVILPGLMDSHMHLSGQDRNGTTGVMPTLWEIYRGAPYKRSVLLDSGITSLRDPGGAPSLEIRDRIARGEILGPRVFAAGPFLYAPGGFPANVVEPEILARFVGVTTTDEGEARAFVRARKDEGADFVKLIYTSGVFKDGEYPSDAPAAHDLPDSWFEEVPILPREVLVAAIDEAKSLGMKTAVHLNRHSEAVDALDAGADWIHHNWHVPETPEGDAFYAQMAAQGACLDPTLLVHATRFPELLHDHEVLRAWNAGVRIDVGTDIGFAAGADALFGDGTWTEMHLLRQAGLPPIEVIRAATLSGAQCLGVDGDQGSLAVGKRADLLVVEGDPLADFDGFTPGAIEGVLVGGVVARWDR